jgi:hypothetical protein
MRTIFAILALFALVGMGGAVVDLAHNSPVALGIFNANVANEVTDGSQFELGIFAPIVSPYENATVAKELANNKKVGGFDYAEILEFGSMQSTYDASGSGLTPVGKVASGPGRLHDGVSNFVQL